MKWYVRSEDGEVWGPMPEGEAESMRDQMSSALDDAVMFNERIFEPQFVTTEEVDNLVIDLRATKKLRQNLGHEVDELVDLYQRAIDTITLLSRDQREKYRDGIRAAAEFAGTYDQQIAGIRHKFEDVILGKFNLVPREEMRDKESGKTFLVDKETTALVTGLLEINRDSQMRKEQVELCEAAAKMLVRLRIPKIVTGTIQGGVLTLEEVSEGVEVDIRDYDTDGVDEEMLTEDEAGTHFQAG